MAAMVWLMLALFCVSGGSEQSNAIQSDSKELGYEEFMKLKPAERQARFVALTAANKAGLKRRHADEWLSEHRTELSASQVHAVESAIAFITADLYLRPDDEVQRRREGELKQELACKLGRERAQDAFTFHNGASRSARSSVERVVDSWLSWFSDCVLRESQ